MNEPGDPLQCWKCGAPLMEMPLPLSRYAQCRECGADLYVCRLCKHYDARWNNACREERAEAPVAKDRANFCDWFSPRPGAFQGPAGNADARAALDALFGGAPVAAGSDETRNALDALFGPDPEKKG